MKMLFVFGLFVTSISAQAFEPSGSTSTISTPIASDWQEQGTLSVRNSNQTAEAATNNNSASTVDVRNSADTVEGQTV